MADTQAEAEVSITALTQLGIYGLHLKMHKTQIMTDQEAMANCTEICGIKLDEHIKYLGVTIYCDR